MRKFLDALYIVNASVACAGISIMFLLILISTAGRNLNIRVAGTDDIVGFSVAAVASLGLAYTFKAGEIIRVRLLIDHVSQRRQRVLEIASLILGTALVGYFAWHAIEMAYDSWRFGDRTSGVISWPLWVPQAIFGYGLLVFFVALLDEAVRVCAGRKPTYSRSLDDSPGVSTSSPDIGV